MAIAPKEIGHWPALMSDVAQWQTIMSDAQRQSPAVFIILPQPPTAALPD